MNHSFVDRAPSGLLRVRIAMLLAATALMTACGGGGDSPVDPVEPVATSYTVGGQITGLGDGRSFIAANVNAAGNPVERATFSANGTYSISLPAGTSYNLRVIAQPAGQTCVVVNGTGVADANRSSVAIQCADTTYKVGGVLSGLPAGQSLVLVLTAGVVVQETTVGENGNFQFGQGITGTYSVTLKSMPDGQSCLLANATGTAASDVANLQVNCVPSTSTVPPTTTPTVPPVVTPPPVVVEPPPVVVVPPPPAPTTVPAVPTFLSVTHTVKSFGFTWSPSATATSYKLMEDPDGASGYSQLGATVTEAAARIYVNVLLHQRVNARYGVQACNVVGCSATSPYVQANLVEAIGYMKASNPNASDFFGLRVALSADGSTLAVSATGEDGNAPGVNGNQANNSYASAGAVYVFARTGAIWSQQAYLKAANVDPDDRFGDSLSLSPDGSVLAIGAPGEDSNATGVGGNATDNSASNAGAVYLFARTGAAWAQTHYIKASNAGANDYFGRSVALAANGSTLVVGAYGEASNATGVNGDQANNAAPDAGAAYVFVKAGSTWTQQAYLKAGNTRSNSDFGASVAVSADGNVVAVGADREDSQRADGSPAAVTGLGMSPANWDAGAVYIYTRTGTTWAAPTYVKPFLGAFELPVGGFFPVPEGTLFGASIALSADGATLVAGAPGDAFNRFGVNAPQTYAGQTLAQAGAAYVFTRVGIAWTQQAHIKGDFNLAAQELFGSAVSLAGNGNLLAVGSPGRSAATNPFLDQGDFSASFAGGGVVYLFGRTGSTWSRIKYLSAPNPGIDDNFGSAVMLSSDGNTLAVGAAGEDSNAVGIGGSQVDNSASNAGAAYLY